MLSATSPRRQARCLRWQSSPWDEHHPDWLRLDQQLPQEHNARLIDSAVDLLDLKPFLAPFCAGFGSSSWHPALLLKLVLYESNRKVHSPAAWHRDCSEHLPLLWLLRGARPSRATLYQCSQRLSPRLLKRLNRQVLLLARREGLCPARRASLDGTFMAARASRHQLLNLKRLDKRLDLLRQASAADAASATDQGGAVQTRPPCWLARSPHGRTQQLQRYQQARLRLAAKMTRHQQRQSGRAKAKRQPVERVLISPREPEAAVGKDKSKVVRPLYDVQLVRDLDSPFLLGYGVFASTSDAGLLPDSIYASVRDLRVCRRRQVVLYAPAKGEQAANKATQAAAEPRQRHALPVLAAQPQKRPKYYGKERFVWEAATRSYLCPAGQRLQRQTRERAARVHGGAVMVEKYGTKACATCQLREHCTRSKRGRQIKRMADEPLVEELRQRMGSAEGKELYRLRKQTIEREFADATEHRGLRRFSGYGLLLAETQVAVLVLLNNLKALLRLRRATKVAA
jgi:transposase